MFSNPQDDLVPHGKWESPQNYLMLELLYVDNLLLKLDKPEDLRLRRAEVMSTLLNLIFFLSFWKSVAGDHSVHIMLCPFKRQN